MPVCSTCVCIYTHMIRCQRFTWVFTITHLISCWTQSSLINEAGCTVNTTCLPCPSNGGAIQACCHTRHTYLCSGILRNAQQAHCSQVTLSALPITYLTWCVFPRVLHITQDSELNVYVGVQHTPKLVVQKRLIQTHPFSKEHSFSFCFLCV